MNLRPEEISKIIKQQILQYNEKLEESETGTVITIGDGIALIHGLTNAMAGELLLFPHDVYGMVLNLEEEHVGAVLMGSDAGIREGDTVKRTGKIVEVPVGDALLGRVVNALGQPIDGKGSIETTKTRPIERVAPGVMTRKSVHQPLQKGKNVNCIYVAIGQKASTVAQIVEKLRQHEALEYTTIVSATASELAPLQYIAPYSGCAMGEEWMEEGKDVLIIYDDLSKHAVAYRTLSLLLKRPPGREAYPGDVFYLHSRLLERAAKLSDQYGAGSLTALPIIETQAGDISAYIPTNVISITDGQIFLQTELFNEGVRPAVDSGLSVSRVGGSAQIKAMKQVSGSLKLELAQYHEMQAFAKFGSDLDDSTKQILEHGAKLTELLKQPQYAPMSVEEQIVSLFAAKNGFLKKVQVKDIHKYESDLLKEMKNHKEILESITTKKVLDDELTQSLKDVLKTFTEDFISKVEA